MGDFSIRCAISGVPIPRGTRVLTFKLGESDRHPGYFYLASMPVEGVMGDCGQADDIDDFYVEGFKYSHVLPDLWKAAGEIWVKAMFKPFTPSLLVEIEQERHAYQRKIKDCERFKGSSAYDSLVELRVRDSGGEWLRRLKHIVLFAPDFGETGEVIRFAKALITEGETLDVGACETLRSLIAGFMSSSITGTSMIEKEETHPFMQYPDLAVDLEWHRAIVKTIEQLRAQRAAEQE